MSRPPVIIIAGGANSRFSPFQDLGHKGAFTLLGQPLFIRTLKDLQKHGFTDVVMVITPRDAEEKISRRMIEERDLGLNVQYVVQPEALGMGDAVLRGVSVLPEHSAITDPLDQRYAVIAAYQINAGEILASMLDHGQDTVLATSTTERPWDYGILSFNETGWASNIVEKPAKGTEPSNKKVLSIYILGHNYIEQLRQTPVDQYNFETALGAELQRQPAPILELMIQLPSLKYPWNLLDFQENLLLSLQSYRATTAEVAPTAVIDETEGAVYIGENAKIGHASKIVGPCYIGDNVMVGDFSLIRKSTLEKNVQIGCFSEIARSIIGVNSHAHSGYIGDSIIAPEARIGAQIVTANKRVDRKTVGVEVKGKVVDSGRKNLGALVGSHVKIGVHVSIMPGKIIASHATIMPHQAVMKNVAAEVTSDKTSKK